MRAGATSGVAPASLPDVRDPDLSGRPVRHPRLSGEAADQCQAPRIAPMSTRLARLLPLLIARSLNGRLAAAQSSSCTTRTKPSQLKNPTAAPVATLLAPA